MKNILLRFDENDYAKMQSVASYEGRSITALVRYVIKNYMAQNLEKRANDLKFTTFVPQQIRKF